MADQKTRKTTVGNIDEDVLRFTVGKDPELDLELAEADCIGSAAHATMLARMRLPKRLFSDAERRRIIRSLVGVIRSIRSGRFRISMDDQDVHMAVERLLTAELGELGRKIHTARSRNDQVAVDLRLYAKAQLLDLVDEALDLADALLRMARRHQMVPMVGRTHMQPAMPSSVGLWASAFAEGILDDVVLLVNAYELNDQSPLGSAASYGVPLPIDRELTSALLGFSRPIGNVLHANNARGKMESVILFACAQAMVTLSRLSQDLILFSMPEFGYFSLPAAYCTGSSIMPQKKNPDVLELIRAKTSAVTSGAFGVMDMLRALPSGYNRDLQAAKEPFMEGIRTTRASLRILAKLVAGIEVNRKALADAFDPSVFAADRALELAASGMPFRDAYRHVKEHLAELECTQPLDAIRRKRHLGAPAGLDLKDAAGRIRAARAFSRDERRAFHRAVSRLLGVAYPGTL